MRSQNISRFEISKILNEGSCPGCFYVPNAVFALPMSKSERLLLIALFKVRYDFAMKETHLPDGWFFVTTKTLASMACCKDVTVTRCRRRLAYMGIIQYRNGQWRKRQATQFKILMKLM